MAKRALVICTANVCRSPVVEGLLRLALDGAVDTDGDAWVVSSAGTAEIEPSVDRFTVAAAARAGVDVSGHRRRTLTGDLLGTDGADLILTMTRAHLRHVAVLDPAAWTRTFTLLELARRASASAPAGDDEPFAAWLGRMGTHRRASEMMRPDVADDVADPYGGPASEHEAMVEQVVAAVTTLVRNGSWRLKG